MDQIRASWDALQETHGKIRDLKEEISALNDNALFYHGALKRMILEGGTTGDGIRDFVIVSGAWNEQEEERYRALATALSGKKGELVLVAGHEEHLVRHVFMPTPGNGNVYEWREFFMLGVLAKDEPEFDFGEANKRRPDCIIPTRCAGSYREGGMFSVGKDAIKEYDPRFGPFFVEGLPLLGRIEPNTVKCVIAGDERVYQWFEERRTPRSVVDGYCEQLGRLVLTSPEA